MTLFRDTPPNMLRMCRPNETDDYSVSRIREEFRASLESDLADTSWHTFVIVAEDLWRLGSKPIARFLEWLTEFVDEISVVAYVRHPVDWTRSVVQERLKGGRTLDQLQAGIEPPRWQQNFTRWLDAVGLERFQLVSFEDARDSEGLLASFCNVAGLPHETILPSAPPKAKNESMSLEAALLLDSFNRQTPLYINGELSPERSQYSWYGVSGLRSLPGNRFYLSPKQEEKARVNSRPDLEWLNATFGKNFFPDVFQDEPGESSLHPDTMPRETIDALAEMYSNLLREQVRAKDLESRSKHLEEQLELAQQTNSKLQEQLEQEHRVPEAQHWEQKPEKHQPLWKRIVSDISGKRR